MYRTEDTIVSYFNYRGVNDGASLFTNPVGESLLGFSSRSVTTTCYGGNIDNAKRRHYAKLNRLNKEAKASA